MMSTQLWPTRAFECALKMKIKTYTNVSKYSKRITSYTLQKLGDKENLYQLLDKTVAKKSLTKYS